LSDNSFRNVYSRTSNQRFADLRVIVWVFFSEDHSMWVYHHEKHS